MDVPPSTASTAAPAAPAAPAATTGGGRWTDAEVAQLLQLRLGDMRWQFEAARRHPQLRAVAWAGLRLRMREWLQLHNRPARNVAQLRAKWLSLRHEVLAVRALEVAGGSTAAAVAYPSYWSMLAAAEAADSTAFNADDDESVARAPGPTSRPRRETKQQEKEDTRDKKERVRWTQPMASALLKLRLEADELGAFSEGRSPGQLRAAWLALRDRLTVQLGGQAPDIPQLKNKLNALRREFATVLERQREQTPVELPTYWPELNALFGRSEATESPVVEEEEEEEDESEAVDVSPPPSPPLIHEEAAVEDALVSPGVRRMKWDADATRTLLLLRGREMRAAFTGEQAPARLKALWETLRGRFEREQGVSAGVSQLKNRYNALRKEFALISKRRAEGEQQEPPVYWDAMELALGSETQVEEEAVRQPPASRKRRRQSRADEPSGVVDAEQDSVKRLEELLRRQAERQEAMRALIERQAREFRVLANETAAVNREVLEFIRNVRDTSSETHNTQV